MLTKVSEKTKKLLERLENNYKLIYVVTMGGTLILALENLALSTNVKTGVWEIKEAGNFTIVQFLLFIIFLITFVRFLLGDLRYLDIKYIESKESVYSLQRYSPFSRFIDFYSLIIHSFFFYALAASISNFVYFYKFYTVILIINSIWLLAIYFSNKRDKNRLESKSSYKWALNNIGFSIALLLYLIYVPDLYLPISLWIFFIFGIGNSLVDYILTWKMYFPKINNQK